MDATSQKYGIIAFSGVSIIFLFLLLVVFLSGNKGKNATNDLSTPKNEDVTQSKVNKQGGISRRTSPFEFNEKFIITDRESNFSNIALIVIGLSGLGLVALFVTYFYFYHISSVQDARDIFLHNLTDLKSLNEERSLALSHEQLRQEVVFICRAHHNIKENIYRIIATLHGKNVCQLCMRRSGISTNVDIATTIGRSIFLGSTKILKFSILPFLLYR